ncbi:MAG: hypothetical protein AB7I41_03300 [Candidatus Sericytochromatia bacterium]
MDFSALAGAREQLVSELNAGHREVSELSAFQGFCCLLAAEQAGYQAPELLKKAADAFGISLQYNRKNPQPLIGLAYLFLLVKDPRGAAPYLAEVEKLAPDYPDLPPLKYWLSGKKPITQADSDADFRYEEVERLISASVAQYLQLHPLPSIEPQLYLRLQEQHMALRQLCERLQNQLSDLQAETESFYKLQPLWEQLKAFEVAVKVSQDFLRLVKRIQTDISEVEKLNQSLQHERTHLNELEQSLESLLDRCDAIADQLDDYDQQGFAIVDVEKYYQTLCQKIENLQESVEDSLARFQPTTLQANLR